MLLSVMRRHAKSWLVKALIFMISFAFIFYFGYSFTATRKERVAYVNGELINTTQYNKKYRDLLEALQLQYQGMWNDNLIKVFDLENRALEELITERLITQEAKKMGFQVTKSEIQSAIMNYPVFQDNGKFSIQKYQALLGQNRMRPEDFEATMAQGLLEAKLRQFFYTFLGVTDQENIDYYTFGNEKIKISFVLFKPERYLQSIKVDQTTMEKFFQEYRESYRIPEKIKIAYITIEPDIFRNQVKVTDEDVSDFYEYHIDSFSQPKEVKARHILIKLDQNATEDQDKIAKDRAESIREKARKGEDFAALAREYSEGPLKSEGGDLGYFSRGRMPKPFEDAAFNMKKGEISEPIRTRFGYHIIKVEDIKEAEKKTLNDVRKQIRETLIKDTSMDLAHEQALTLVDQMPYNVNLSAYAAEHGFQARETGYLSQDQEIAEIGGSPNLMESLFSLEEGEATEVMELNEKFYIFQASERKESYLPELKEVSKQVEKDLLKHLSEEEARKAAEKFLTQVKNGKSWSTLAKGNGVKPRETAFFSRLEPIPEIGNDFKAREMVFALGPDKRYPETVFENDKGVFVARWEARKEIDTSQYKKESEKYDNQLIQEKFGYAFMSWLQGLREAAEIKIVASFLKE